MKVKPVGLGSLDAKAVAENVCFDLAETVYVSGVGVEEADHGRAEQMWVDCVEVVSGVSEDVQEGLSVGL